MPFPWFEEKSVAALELVVVVFFEQMEASPQDMDEFPGIDDPGRVRTMATGNEPAGLAGADAGRGRMVEEHRRNRIAFMGKHCLVETESA